MVSMRKPNPVLEDMPSNVLERIVTMGMIEERYRIRKVCKSLQSKIDSMNLQMTELAIWIHDSYACFDFVLPEMRYMIAYRDHLDGCTVRKEDPENDEDEEEEEPQGVLQKGRSFWEAAARDLSIFLKNPKLKISNFKITMTKSIFSDLFFEELFKDQKLSSWYCRHLITRYDGPDGDLVPLVSHINPAHLKSIRFEKMDPAKPITVIVETPQWKNAKILDIDHIEKMMDFEDLKHFEMVDIGGIEELTVEQFGQIFEHFSTTTTLTMQRCSIGANKIDFENLKPLLETENLKLEPTTRFTREFKNLNANSRFSVTVSNGGVCFRRVKA